MFNVAVKMQLREREIEVNELGSRRPGERGKRQAVPDQQKQGEGEWASAA